MDKTHTQTQTHTFSEAFLTESLTELPLPLCDQTPGEKRIIANTHTADQLCPRQGQHRRSLPHKAHTEQFERTATVSWDQTWVWLKSNVSLQGQINIPLPQSQGSQVLSLPVPPVKLWVAVIRMKPMHSFAAYWSARTVSAFYSPHPSFSLKFIFSPSALPVFGEAYLPQMDKGIKSTRAE